MTKAGWSEILYVTQRGIDALMIIAADENPKARQELVRLRPDHVQFLKPPKEPEQTQNQPP